MTQTDQVDGGVKPGPLVGGALAIAILVIVAWLGYLTWIILHVETTEVEWSRFLVVLGSLEAVAFAAAGALFGTTVQRQRVEEQKARADAAESRAEAKESEAVNGQKLATAVKIFPARRPVGTRERLSVDTESEADPLVQLANQLFPE